MADGVKSEELYVEIKSSSKTASTALESLSTSLEKTADKVWNLTTKVAILNNKLTDLMSSFKIEINTDEAVKNLTNVQNKLEEIQKSLKSTQELTSSIGGDMAETPNMENIGSVTEEALGGLKDEAGDEVKDKVLDISSALGLIAPELGLILKAGTKVAQKFEEIKAKVKEMQQAIISGANKILDIYKKIGLKVLDFGKSMLTSINPISKIKESAKGLVDSFKRALGTAKQYLLALFGIRTAYTVIRNSALEWLNSSNAGAVQLKANLDYIKGALGTAVAPLMIRITNLVYQLLRAVQQVVYFFTGWNMFSAATAKNLASGAGSAKKMKEQLADFDELHVLDFGDSSGGGGGGAVAPTFDLSNLESFWDKFDGDWYKLGQEIGNKITEALDKIPWDKIKAKAREIGDHLADFLNGMMTTDVFYALGKTMAEGFNTALNFLDGFIKKFHFKDLGINLAKGLKGITDNIEWDTLRDVLVGGLNGVFETMFNFFETYKWKELGQKIGTLLQETFDGFDAVKAGEALARAVNSIIRMAHEILKPDNVKLVTEKIFTMFSVTMKDIRWTELADTLIDGLVSLTKSMADFVKNDSNWENMKINVKTAMNHMFDETKWDEIAKNLGVFVDEIVSFLNDLPWTKISYAVERLVGSLPWEEVAKLTGNIMRLKSIIFATEWSNALGPAIKLFINQLLFDTLTHLVNGLTTVLLTAVSILSPVLEFFGVDVDNLKNKINEASAKMVEGINSAFGTETTEKVTTFQGTFSRSLQSVGDDMDTAKERFKIWKEKGIEGLKEYDTSLEKTAAENAKNYRIINSKIAENGVQLQLWSDDVNTSYNNAGQSAENCKSELQKTFEQINGSAKTSSTEITTHTNGMMDSFFSLNKGINTDMTGSAESVTSFTKSVQGETKELKSQLTYSGNDWEQYSTDVDTSTIDMTNSTEQFKNDVTNKFTELKTNIENTMTDIKNNMRNSIEELKSYFNFEWSLPTIKIPHFRIDWDMGSAEAEAFKKAGLQGKPQIRVDYYAKGGFPDKGDLFIANEAGAEWVGSMKGQTAVANNQQITQGIKEASYEGMYQAIKDAGLGNIVNKVYLGTKEVTKEITKQQRSNANMYG